MGSNANSSQILVRATRYTTIAPVSSAAAPASTPASEPAAAAAASGSETAKKPKTEAGAAKSKRPKTEPATTTVAAVDQGSASAVKIAEKLQERLAALDNAFDKLPGLHRTPEEQTKRLREVAENVREQEKTLQGKLGRAETQLEQTRAVIKRLATSKLI